MKFLITGGAGFIGSNLARRLISLGEDVVIVDDLSRKGSGKNLDWLRSISPKSKLTFHNLSIVNDQKDLNKEINQGVDAVYHLAAQVAVTTSVDHPRQDFEINALGTFNILEAIRQSRKRPFLLYSSTNKVYGGMDNVVIVEEKTRYRYRDYPRGVSEKFPLDFLSPYGCSKGAADQYVHDYAKIYGIPTVVFRQSCIYGERQFGVEDQGWLAWFIIAAILGKPITIYGDGKQVRDALYISDLIDAYLGAFHKKEVTIGKIYNIGGGPDFSISVWIELKAMLENILGRKIDVNFGDWRPGDQKVYISDISKAQQEFGWRPHVSLREGLGRLVKWAKQNQNLFSDF